MKIDPPPVLNAPKAPCPSVPPLKGGGTVGQHGGFVPWDTRGTAWDSGTAPTATAPKSRLPRLPATGGKLSEFAEIDSHITNPSHHERIQNMNANPTTNQTDHRTAAALMHRPDVSPKVLQARIRFAMEWGLRKRAILSIPEPQTERGEEWSHPEAFRDWHGRIVQIVNNYGSPPPAILGMKFVGCLYREDTRTYAGCYATLGELRARTEAAGSGEKFFAARHLFAEPPTPRRNRLRSRSKATT